MFNVNDRLIEINELLAEKNKYLKKIMTDRLIYCIYKAATEETEKHFKELIETTKEEIKFLEAEKNDLLYGTHNLDIIELESRIDLLEIQKKGENTEQELKDIEKKEKYINGLISYIKDFDEEIMSNIKENNLKM